MIWWQRVLNAIYRTPVYFPDGTRILYFPREALLRYLVPQRPDQFVTVDPKAALWIPLRYVESSKQLHVRLADVESWEIPTNEPLGADDRSDISQKLKIYVAGTRGRFVLDL